jgi:hypothetical protein
MILCLPLLHLLLPLQSGAQNVTENPRLLVLLLLVLLQQPSNCGNRWCFSSPYSKQTLLLFVPLLLLLLQGAAHHVTGSP